MMTTEPTEYPDIEIYLKHVNPDDLVEWLRTRFGQCEISKQSRRVTELNVGYQEQIIPVLIVEKAQGIFTSLLFESNHTPWANDKACGLEAYEQFNTEIRCNADSWQEGAEPDEWLSISEEGEKLINWPG